MAVRRAGKSRREFYQHQPQFLISSSDLNALLCTFVHSSQQFGKLLMAGDQGEVRRLGAPLVAQAAIGTSSE